MNSLTRIHCFCRCQHFSTDTMAVWSTKYIIAIILVKEVFSSISLIKKRVAECPYPSPCRCYEDYSGKPDFVVDCAKTDINSTSVANFDKNWTRTIDRLLLHTNKLFKIHDHTFKGMPVVEIHLFDANIKSLEEDSFVGIPKLRSLNLWENDLDTSSFGALRKLNNLLKLDLSTCTSPYGVLPANAFKGMDSLQELDITNCGVTRIESSAFDGLKSLKKLNLQSNDMPDIPDAIESIPNLEELDLSLTGLSILPSDVFMKLTKLKVLHLNLNNLSTYSITDNTFSGLNDTLEHLDLSDNRMEHVPTNAITNLINLKILKLTKNKIVNIPRDAFKGLVNLEKLFLDYNDEESLTIQAGAFNDLENLRFLDLHYTGLKSIPRNSISNLRNLESILLYNNKISDIPADTFKIDSKLRMLNLNNNELTIKSFHEDSFAGLEESLESLQMVDNKLIGVPSHCLTRLRHLKNLDLARNDIGTLPPDVFKGLDSLVELNVGFNPLRLNGASFRGLEKNLRYLKMAGVGLPSLHLESLVPLKDLDSLDVSHNHLESLTRQSFAGLKVKKLSLEKNQISSISSDTFDDLPTPLSVHLQDNMLTNLDFVKTPCIFKQLLVERNPLECTCHEYKLSKYQDVQLNASIPITTSRISATCKRPMVLHDVDIMSDSFHSVSVSRCPDVSEELRVCPVSSSVRLTTGILVFFVSWLSVSRLV